MAEQTYEPAVVPPRPARPDAERECRIWDAVYADRFAHSMRQMTWEQAALVALTDADQAVLQLRKRTGPPPPEWG